MTSMAAALAYRAAASLWRAMTNEPPPRSRVAGWIVHGPIKSRVLRLMDTDDVPS